jgi:hypothetical protein
MPPSALYPPRRRVLVDNRHRVARVPRRSLCTECGTYDGLPDLELCNLCNARHLDPRTLGPIDPNDTKDPCF